MEQRKEAIMAALDAFARQRPGLEFGNYGNVSAYRSESRSITRDLHDYNALAGAVRWRDSITADDLMRAARDAYSGRLTIVEREWHQFTAAECPGAPCSVDCDHRQFRGFRIEYVTGQYFPTEYRKAACAVLASALWGHARANMPAPVAWRVESWGAIESRERSVFLGLYEAITLLAEKGGQQYGIVREYYKLDAREGLTRKNLVSAGNWLRAHFRAEFGARLASRWFR